MQNMTVSAADANRNFSKLLRSVREGSRVTITSHGEPVAELAPVQSIVSEEVKRRRLEALERIRIRRALMPKEPIGRWTRDELYDDALGL